MEVTWLITERSGSPDQENVLPQQGEGGYEVGDATRFKGNRISQSIQVWQQVTAKKQWVDFLSWRRRVQYGLSLHTHGGPSLPPHKRMWGGVGMASCSPRAVVGRGQWWAEVIVHWPPTQTGNQTDTPGMPLVVSDPVSPAFCELANQISSWGHNQL